MTRIPIYLEITAQKVFACGLDWPGWCRSGKDEALALDALVAAAARYAPVAALAGESFPDVRATDDLEIVERIQGGSGTAFGVPSANTEHDRRPVMAPEAARLAALVEAAWTTFDRVRERSPEALRKGPRGGGRDRDRMTGHVIEADVAYASELGRRHRVPAIDDRPAIGALRGAILEVLRTPSDGTPLAGRKWAHRYAARRIAWHALDHAWEMDDRSQPG